MGNTFICNSYIFCWKDWDNMYKNEQKLKSKRFYLALIAMLIPIIIILALLWCNVKTISKIPFESVSKDFPGTIIFLLEFGITIIAITVAVWIGLNIYNLVAKDDLITIEERIKELNELEGTLTITQKNHNELLRTFFISSLIKTQTDEMTLLFINEISKIDIEELDSTFLVEMTFLEEAFANIVSAYNKRNRKTIEGFYESGMKYCDKISDRLSQTKIAFHTWYYQAYICFRRADFKFYYSVRPSNPPNRSNPVGVSKYCSLLSEAIDDYNRVRNILPNECKSKTIECYLNNSIGYCYHEKYMYQNDYGNLEAAINYCKKACYPDGEDAFLDGNNDNSYAHSIYYRNYAHCIGAKSPNLSGLKESRIHYMRSLELDYRDAKAHYNFANVILKIVAENEGIGRNRKQTLNLCKIMSIESKNDVDDAIKSLHWAIVFDTYFTDPYFLCAYAYSLKILTVENKEEKEKYFKKAKYCIDTYKKLAPSNNTDAYRFYERNLYEAYGDLNKARGINTKLVNDKRGGDCVYIAQLYENTK